LVQRNDWPHVRQLQNERAVALARDGESLGIRHLSAADAGSGDAPAVSINAAPAAAAVQGARKPLREARAEFEASFIAEALRQHHGNVSRTAAGLGLSRVMLQRKMKDYGLRE
jgi:two-component system response regulator HupR/HoxA